MAPDQKTIDPIESPEVGELDPVTLLPAAWYDRSAVRGDSFLIIPDQTEEEFLRRQPDSPFCEFIDGTVYMHGVEDQHQFDVQFLIVLLSLFDSVRGVGVVLSGPGMLRLRDGCWLEPDIFVMPPGYASRAGDLTPAPPALLIVEVLSPSNRGYDIDQKDSIYREADAAEVWYIDHRDRVVIVDRRTADGRGTSQVASGPLRSTGVPGFWFDVDWLWADPRPNLMRCFERILAGPPA